MAMRVDDDVGRFCIERQGVGIVAQNTIDETFEEEAASGDVFGVRQTKLTIIFDEHRVAGRFEEEDGCVLLVLT